MTKNEQLKILSRYFEGLCDIDLYDKYGDDNKELPCAYQSFMCECMWQLINELMDDMQQAIDWNAATEEEHKEYIRSLHISKADIRCLLNLTHYNLPDTNTWDGACMLYAAYVLKNIDLTADKYSEIISHN